MKEVKSFISIQIAVHRKFCNGRSSSSTSVARSSSTAIKINAYFTIGKEIFLKEPRKIMEMKQLTRWHLPSSTPWTLWVWRLKWRRSLFAHVFAILEMSEQEARLQGNMSSPSTRNGRRCVHCPLFRSLHFFHFFHGNFTHYSR